MISKKILIPIVAVAAIGAGIYGTSQVSAASASTPHQSLAQTIASAFNLDPSKVQAVVNQYRSTQSGANETNYQNRLAAAVTDGKLTGSQEASILAEHNTLEAQLSSAGSLTGSARAAAIKQVRQDAKAWAQTNNVSVSWLLGPGHLRGGRITTPATS
jgi:phage portal protein BeeE